MVNKLLIILLLLCACGPKPEAANTNTTNDVVNWEATGPWWANDMAPKKDRLQVVTWVLAYNQICESAVHYSSDTTLVIVLSIQISDPQPSDINCSYFNGNWTYSLNENTLQICQQNEPCVELKHGTRISKTHL